MFTLPLALDSNLHFPLSIYLPVMLPLVILMLLMSLLSHVLLYGQPGGIINRRSSSVVKTRDRSRAC